VAALGRAGWLLVKGMCLRLLIYVMRSFGATETPYWLERVIARYEHDVAAASANLTVDHELDELLSEEETRR
jgi:hypothetical protein